MKKVSDRQLYIELLVAMIRMHTAEYSPYRKYNVPEMSIHGKDQRIRVVFHSQNQVPMGELILECPINDPTPDTLDVSNVLKTTPTDDWMGFMEKLGFMKREDKRDLYFGLDVFNIMAHLGFDIKACLATTQRIYVTGHFQAFTMMGRFSCWFDVTMTNRNGYHTLKEGYTIVNTDGTKVPYNRDIWPLFPAQPTDDDLKPYEYVRLMIRPEDKLQYAVDMAAAPHLFWERNVRGARPERSVVEIIDLLSKSI